MATSDLWLTRQQIKTCSISTTSAKQNILIQDTRPWIVSVCAFCHQARSVSFNNKVSYINDEASYMDTRSMMFDGPETRQTPPTSPATSPPRRHSPRSPSIFTTSITSIQRVISWAQLRGLLTRGQEETPVWTSLHQTSRHWPRTNTQSFSSPSWNITFGTLLTTATGQSQGPRKNHHPKVTSFKTIWLISRPIMCYIDLHGQFSLHRPPWTFKDHQKAKITNFSTPKEDRWQKRQLDNLIHHRHHHHFVYINVFMHSSDSKKFISRPS